MASGIATEKKTPLFRSVDKKKQLTENPMNRNDVGPAGVFEQNVAFRVAGKMV